MANSTFTPYIRNGGATLAKAKYKGTVRYPPREWFYWRQVIDFSLTPGSIGAVALTAGTSQEIDLHTAFPDNLFPADVQIDGAAIKLLTVCSGGSVATCTASVGDTGVPAELIDTLDVFTGATLGWYDDIDEPNDDRHIETAYIPTLTMVTTTDNVDALTAGRFEVFIGFSPLPQSA